MSQALILLGGELGDAASVRRLAKPGVPVLCADGGLRHAVRLKLKPWVVVGDMDSLPSPLPRWKDTVYFLDADQDRSDFEKTLDFARERGVRAAWVAGAMGGRLDHQLVNLALIERYGKSMMLGLAGNGRAVLAGPGLHTFNGPKGRTLTLLAAPKARATTSGLRYRLKNETLSPGSRGLSNEATSKRVRVKIHSGRAWVIEPWHPS